MTVDVIAAASVVGQAAAVASAVLAVRKAGLVALAVLRITEVLLAVRALPAALLT